MAETTACIIYGPELNPAGNPKIEYDQLITDREGFGAVLGTYGVDLALAHALPCQPGETQQYNFLARPKYFGDVVDMDHAQAHYQRVTGETLSELTQVALDRWSANWGNGIPAYTPPVLNVPEVQQYGANKLRMSNDVLRHGLRQDSDGLAHALGVPTYALDAIMDTDPLRLCGAEVIAKPNDGGLGVGFHAFQDTKALRTWASGLSETDRRAYIVQPRLNFSGKLPFLAPYSSDKADQRALEVHNVDGPAKEVRMYTVYDQSTDTVETMPVPRVTARGDVAGVDRVVRDFFAADPEILNEQLHHLAAAAVRRLAEKTGAPAIYAAVDLGYDPLVDWVGIELNCRFPHPIDRRTHEGLSSQVRSMLAKRIAALALAR